MITGYIFFIASWIEIVTAEDLFQNTFIFRTLRVANFADIIKILTLFTKTTFKGSKKFKKLETIY